MPRGQMFQDNRRESHIAAHLALIASEQRAGADATDSSGNPFELKSVSNTQVTTARDVGVHTIEKWRETYWVVGSGTQDEDGRLILSELYVAHPDDLESWFGRLEGILRAEEQKCERVLQAALKAKANASDIEFVRQKCQRGITRNNPKIPLQLFRDHGQRLNHKNSASARKELAEFVEDRPLD